MKTAEQYKEEYDELAEQMNVISELLLGYREGSYPEIIQSIAHFKTKAYKHEMNEKVEELFNLIDELSDTKDNILADT